MSISRVPLPAPHLPGRPRRCEHPLREEIKEGKRHAARVHGDEAHFQEGVDCESGNGQRQDVDKRGDVAGWAAGRAGRPVTCPRHRAG